MIKINSELPLCMLDENVELNGMDFVLFHLYASNEQYRQYYLNLRLSHPERPMILDNSAYEFYVRGEELNLEEYFKVIKELQPDYYICPDKLMDAQATLNATMTFDGLYGDRVGKSQPMVVAQGATAAEMDELMEYYLHQGFRNLCLPFHNSFFRELASDTTRNVWRVTFGWLNDDMLYAAGRCDYVNSRADKLRQFKYVHLLGSHNPWEKYWHEKYSPGTVHSMDTGYPVKVGLYNYELFEEPNKPEVIIDEFLDKNIRPELKDMIRKNVRKFADL